VQTAQEREQVEPWDADTYHAAWQARVDQALTGERRTRQETRTGDDHARQSGPASTLAQLGAWAGMQRADAQRDQHDRRRALERDQDVNKGKQEELWFQSYGQYRQAEQHKMHEIEARQARGGLCDPWFQKVSDDQAFAACKAAIANSQWSETQARDAYDKALQEERDALEKRFAQENAALEQKIAQAFATRQIPAPAQAISDRSQEPDSKQEPQPGQEATPAQQSAHHFDSPAGATADHQGALRHAVLEMQEADAQKAKIPDGPGWER
jgi:fused signal recognition particle receptor